MSLRIGVTGFGGRVGTQMLKMGAFPLGCDVTNPLQIQHAIKYTKPDVVVHLAAISDVDYCEKPENEGKVINVNFNGTWMVAEIVEQYGCGMVVLSSDHIFPGSGWFRRGKYKENDTPKPKNTYGLTKLAAEQLTSAFDNFKVVRTSYLFNKNRLKDEIDSVENMHKSYPAFIYRSFLHVNHFAVSLWEYLNRFSEMPDILHLSGSDNVSWYEFMLDLADEFGYKRINVSPRRYEFEGFAPRGHKLGLDTSLSMKLGFHQYNYLDGIRLMKATNE